MSQNIELFLLLMLVTVSTFTSITAVSSCHETDECGTKTCWVVTCKLDREKEETNLTTRKATWLCDSTRDPITRGFTQNLPTINALSIWWHKYRFMLGDYTFFSGGNRNCRTILSFQPNSTVKSIIRWEPGRSGGKYSEMTRHTFSFQSPVFTKNIFVTHFHHNPLVSMLLVKMVLRIGEEERNTNLILFIYFVADAFPWASSVEKYS